MQVLPEQLRLGDKYLRNAENSQKKILLSKPTQILTKKV